MDISSDYKDLFKILNKGKVRYLIIGAYAVVFYTEPRFTKDVDIWIDPDTQNADRLYKALVEFGAPLTNVAPEDFTNKKTIYQMGVAPVRIDILMGLSDLKFADAWPNRKKSKYGDIPVNILGLKELVYSKQKAGREQDILDLKKLSRLK